MVEKLRNASKMLMDRQVRAPPRPPPAGICRLNVRMRSWEFGESAKMPLYRHLSGDVPPPPPNGPPPTVQREKAFLSDQTFPTPEEQEAYKQRLERRREIRQIQAVLRPGGGGSGMDKGEGTLHNGSHRTPSRCGRPLSRSPTDPD